MENQKLNKEELTAFILLYVANADMKIDADEMEFINKFIGDEELHHVKKLFDKANDIDCLNIIQSNKKNFASKEEKELLYEDISKLIQSNDESSEMEQALLLGLKKLI